MADHAGFHARSTEVWGSPWMGATTSNLSLWRMSVESDRSNPWRSRDRKRAGCRCRGIGAQTGSPMLTSTANLCRSASRPLTARPSSSPTSFQPTGDLGRHSPAACNSPEFWSEDYCYCYYDCVIRDSEIEVGRGVLTFLTRVARQSMKY